MVRWTFGRREAAAVAKWAAVGSSMNIVFGRVLLISKAFAGRFAFGIDAIVIIIVETLLTLLTLLSDRVLPKVIARTA